MVALRLGMMVSLALCALPVVLAAASSLTAQLLGCRVDEANAYPCMIGSVNIGGILSGFYSSAWLLLLTLPLGVCLLMAWGVITLVRR